MGWSAHGANCGGLPNEPDDKIKQLLFDTAEGKVQEYPLAKHFIYFVTVDREQGKEETVVYRIIREPGSD